VRQLERLDPNLALAAAAVAVVATEAAYRTWISDAWLLLEALVAAVALVHAWREQDRLRLGPVLAVIGGLQLALFGVHVALDVTGDKDSSIVYRWQGNGLVRGDYPRSEYPLGAVLLFGLEAWLGGGATRNANALLMAPLAIVTSAAVWLTRTPYAAWLAALIGFWPANAFFWQYKFDLAPAALLVLGLLLALRGRWGLAGVALAAGTLVKWTPVLAVVALVAWLLTTRRTREAVTHASAFTAAIAIVYLPFLVWSPSEVLAAYERQSGRSITPESVWYLLLRPFDLAHVRTHVSFSAGAPRWANVGAGLLQAAVVLALVVVAARARTQRAAVALAALAPVAFLLTNRIFSPQFALVAFAAWALAAALVVRTRREQLWVGVAMAAAALANSFVYPFALPRYDLTWPLCSLVLFAVGGSLTVWLAGRASSIRGDVVLGAERHT
jgi:Glycosyltransferase family 87